MAINVKAKNQARAKNRLLGILIALLFIVLVCILTAASSAEARKTITVVRIKDNPIPANALITSDMVEQYSMYYKEFDQYGTITASNGTKYSAIVKWDDKDLLIGQRYAAYYLRNNTYIFWDSTLQDQTRKNSYLYSMSGELLNIKLNTVDDFGTMVVPGDKLNIRAAYDITIYNLPTEAEYQLTTNNGGTFSNVTTSVVSPLFSEVQVLDMLNKDGNSIFDIYYEYISMTKAQQQEALADEAFLDTVTPDSILLEVTAEEVEHFMEMQAAGATYQITLLPRESSTSITDSLSDIQEALAGIAGLKS